MTDKRFANWFKKKLDEPGRRWTKADFAREASVPFSTVQSWASGRSLPSPHYCDVISDVLGIDLDLVLWQAGHRPNIQVIDPEDPRSILMGLINTIDWTNETHYFHMIEGMLHTVKNGQIRGKGEK